MRIGLRLGARSLLVLVIGIPFVLWQAFRSSSPALLIGGLAGVAVAALVLSVHLIVPRGEPRNSRQSVADPVALSGLTRVASPRSRVPGEPPRNRPTPVTLSPSLVRAETTPLSVPVRRPSTGPLRAQIDHNREHLETILLDPSPEEAAWIQLGPDIKRTFAEELSRIRSFVDDVLIVLRPGGLLQLQHDIDEASDLLSTGAWCAGRSAALANPELRASLATTNAGEIAVIPPRFRGPVEDAIEYAQWVFASVFHPYYASVYGEAVRSERDGHFMDMYREFTRVAVLSFLAGVHSV